MVGQGASSGLSGMPPLAEKMAQGVPDLGYQHERGGVESGHRGGYMGVCFLISL